MSYSQKPVVAEVFLLKSRNLGEKRLLVPLFRTNILLTSVKHQIWVRVEGCPRACRFRKYQNLNRSPGLALPTFFKTWFLLYKMWLKLAKIDQKWNFSIFLKKSHFFLYSFKTVCGVFHDMKNVKNCQKSLKIGHFWHILANFGHILWI
jgi:hypothetical protein